MFNHPDIYLSIAKQREAEFIQEAARRRLVACATRVQRHRDRWPDAAAARSAVAAKNNVTPVGTLASCDLEPESVLAGRAR